MKLIIVENPGRTVVAVIDNYTGPVPRQGEYIFHPPLDPARNTPEGVVNVMSVNTVTYGIIAQPQNGEDHFTGLAEPFVEIHI